MNHSVFLARVLPVLFLAASTSFAQPIPSAAPASPQPGPVPNLPPLQPPAAVAPGEEMVGPLNMPGDSIDSVLLLIERWTGKILLRPQNLPQATISFNLKERIPKKEAIQGLETVLNLNGVAVTPLGDRYLKATSLNLVKSEAPEFIEGSTQNLPPSGRTASKLFTLQFLRVTELMPQLQGLLNPGAGSPPVIFDKGNSALITDSVSNLQRMESLIAKLDQPSLNGLTAKFYQIQHGAKASDVVNKLNTILGGQLKTQLGTNTVFNADDRTNQIALIADPRQYIFFDELIAKLDVKSETNTRNEVIQLKHATAKDVATVLTQLVTGQNNAAKSAGQDNVLRPTQPAANTAAPAPAPAPAAPPVQPSVLATALASQGVEVSANQFSSLLTILSDERTNAIVVSGTIDDIRLVKELIDKIDIILAQVRIEIVAVEVRLTDSATSGIDSLGLRISNGKLTGLVGTAAGVTVAGLPSSTSTATSTDYATLVGGLNAIIGVSTTPRKDNTTISSVPAITTTHNKEATIFVGETRPTITGSTSSNAAVGATNPYTTSSITQQEIGLKITVKPLIGGDGSVQLALKQEISEAGPEVKIDNNVQNVILKRTTDQFITAKSGEILYLGSLQKKTNSKATSRLGPIPILGDLFGRRTRSEVKNEIIFFLRPTVLTNTPSDNTPALDEVEKLPIKKHREEVQKALGIQLPPPAP